MMWFVAKSPRVAEQYDVNSQSINQPFSSAPNFDGENPDSSWGPPTSIPPSNLTRGLTAPRLFRVPPCHKGIIYL
ncbi:hypothetical protein TNCV_1169091 [Trichonephila clavipes]|uniref:Uncharacterized protein n=1 Tax=Trichonephila clavipes TaxID=2585209 RepID=A0A8X6T2G2_TRICX|nr:hypothetical protein TNCV_1169091 [Trichonephila clavipes]